MNLQECLRARSVGALLLLVVLAFAALAAGCSNPEKAKAEYLSRGQALLKEAKYQEASIEFRNAIQIDEKLAAAHWGLAQAYEKLGRVVESVEELRKTVQLDPSNVSARLRLGNAYLLGYSDPKQRRAEYLDEAERYAREILAQDENNIDGQILLANVVYLKAQPDQAHANEQALKMLRHAIELDPQRVESYMGLAHFYINIGKTEDAEATYRQAISVNDRSSLAHIEYGKFLVQTNHNEQAEAEFKKAVEVDGQNRDVRWVLASFYLVNRRMDKAEEAYKAWAQLDWETPDGRSRLADYYATVGRYDDAANLYQEINGKWTDYTRGHYRLGEIMLQRGDAQGASLQVADLLKRNPRDQDALFLRARMNLANNNVKDAVNDLKTVLDQEPRSQLGLYFMSEALYRDGQLEQARTRAGELERYYPDFLPAKLLQVQINFDAGDAGTAKKLATELLDRLSKTAPNGVQSPQLLSDLKATTLILRGKANLSLGNTSKSQPERASLLAAARSDVDAARVESPNSPLPYVNIADVAFAQGKSDEAEQNLEHALSLDRTNFQALNGLVNLLAGQRRLDVARTRMEQLVGEQPNKAPLQYLRAQSYRYGNEQQPPDAARAEEALRRAVEIDPDYVQAYSALADIYFSTNRTDEAVAEYRKITERRSDYVDAYRKLGLIESGRKNLDAAEKYYRRVLEIEPDEAVAANNLAMFYADFDRGNGDEAMRLAQSIVRRFPDDAGFADTLGWVYYKKGLYPAAVEQLQKAVNGAVALHGDNS
ncbi:MAG: tetratricopeptide repeat protein, partial [Acidobacteria bacterium]|nr:tetratricopeptide repeat protein [Acidobacteriota bacterium]